MVKAVVPRPRKRPNYLRFMLKNSLKGCLKTLETKKVVIGHRSRSGISPLESRI